MTIYEKVTDFAATIVDRWGQNQPIEYNADTIQQQYLFAMASGALRSLHSFATLEQANSLHDLPIIARILLERSVRADFARRSKANAIALMISEGNERIDKMEKFLSLRNGNVEGLKDKIDSLKEDLAELEKHLEAGYPRGLNVFRIFELCDLEAVYRSAYHLFSQPVHGSFHSGFQSVKVDPVMRFVMLMAPVETANFLHMVVAGEAAPGYWDLRGEIKCAAFEPETN